MYLKILWKMEHLLQKSKCSIFHNIFKYMNFKGVRRRYYGVKGYIHIFAGEIFEINSRNLLVVLKRLSTFYVCCKYSSALQTR